MQLSDRIEADSKRLSWINENSKANAIYVDNSFQRRSVWVEKNKVRLIESILTGYPIPELYFWAQPSDPTTGHAKFSVVDGQQRIRAIRQFIGDDLRLYEKHLDDDNKSASFANKIFSELGNDQKRVIWDYKLEIRTIPSDISKSAIKKMFLRLNETDKSLNPQELRHAEFNGEFIKACEELANKTFWNKWNVFSPAQIRRMGDIQTCSRFLIFLRRGFDGEISQSAINTMYDHYNDTYSSKQADVDLCESVIERINQLFNEDEKLAKFFKTQVHLYSLFIAILIFIQQKKKLSVVRTGENLSTFVNLYKLNDEDTDIENELTRYRLASNEGMLKKSSRELRVKKILSLLST